ncbi:hypothetical protein BH09BAC3_BH09BAC3_18790 [soil metagenome]
MKTTKLIFLMFVLLAGQRIVAQDIPLVHGSYVVVIGAFSNKSNAAHFTTHAKELGFTPQVELNNFRNLFYVVVLETEDRQKALDEANKLRTTTAFKDAWVFKGAISDLATVTKNEDIHPVSEEAHEVIEEKSTVIEQPVVVVPVVIVPTAADSAKMRAEKIKEQVDKQVMTMKKGEMDRLDYIFFYKDAAVLRPESQYEVDKLVRLLKENPNEKIRIHGHTNGNDPGKIIKHGPKITDFFSLENTLEDYGSAKKLSELRAEVIKDYLSSQGIDKKRMTVKAWGGKKPLYKVDDDKAEANVRVEIEVINNKN